MSDPRWQCPNCKSKNVEISLPTWYRESKSFELEFVETDHEAKPTYWHCNDCNDSGHGQPDEVS